MERTRGEWLGTDRFEIRRRLGQGGMGVVYEAFDRERGELVALKTLSRVEPQTLLRFKTEFRALHDIQHPNLASLYELFEERGEWFFTMELVPGVDFLSHVRRRRIGSLASRPTAVPGERSFADDCDEARLRSALRQLAQGIAALHAADRVHRDIKPSNIRVTPEGRAVLLDFGLVKPVSRRDPSTGGLVGTAVYMAPEQALGGDVAPAIDWFALGVVLYEALTGELPHHGGTALQLVLAKQRPPPPPRHWVPDVPADLDELAARLLAPAPEARPSAAEVLATVDARAGEAPSENPSPGDPVETFVGRADELAALREAFVASQREPVVVLVEGASGLGKSELLQRFADAIMEEVPDAVFVAGRCYERDSVAFKAFDGLVDELSRHLVRLPKEDAAAVLPLRAGLLPRLFPVLQRVEAIAAAPVEEEPRDPQELRRRIFGALRELLARLAQRSRLVLLLDDLQWTDRDSLALLQEVLGDVDAPRLLVVGATRPMDPELRERLIAAIRGVKRRHVALDPLSSAQAERLAAQLLPSSPPETLARVAAEAGGYPLFVMELARHIARATDPLAADEVDLDEVLWERISRLPDDQLPVLQIVCTATARLTLELAAHAAELSQEALFHAVAGLRAAQLIRTTGARRTDWIEPFHDRIRETVEAHLSPPRRRACHQRLAIALARAGAASSSPHALVGHSLAAGDAAGAARHAEAAARDAVAATAFDRAVDFFRMALELGQHEDERRRALWLELAWALLNAGRGAESAAAFDTAADGADPATRRDCQRLAAEQLLISGHIEEGLDRLGAALGEIGEPRLETPRRALLALVWRRFWLRVRGVDWRERPASEISDAERARLQVLGAAALGLSMVDSIRGAAFNARFAQVALATGDPLQVARALGAEATVSSYQGRYERARRLIRALEAIEARHPDDAYISAWGTISRGGLAYFLGDFAWAEAAMRRAGAILSRVGGTAWERNNSSMFILFCLRYRGELRMLDGLVESLRRDAERRGDIYMEISVRRYGGRYAWLADDRPEEALRDLETTDWPAPETVFHLQDWQRLEARCEIALYAGSATAIRAAAESDFESLSRSLLPRISTVRYPSTYLRGRLLLACDPGETELRAVERLARSLLRAEERYPRVFAELLVAGVAHRRGDDPRAVAALGRAVETAGELGMAFHRAAAQRRLAALIGGDEGASLRAASEAWMKAQAVRDPERLVTILAPGFDGPQ